MKTLQVYGASDDLIEFSGIEGADEFDICDHPNSPYVATFAVDKQLKIHVLYDGRWSFAVGQYDKDIPLPNWPIRISTKYMYSNKHRRAMLDQFPEDKEVDRCYSTLLEIDVPDDAKLKLIKPLID